MPPSPTLTTQQLRQRGTAFRALHERDRPFIVPNPWDVGSARLLATAGFEALATTSAGFAASLGRPDGSVSAEAILDHTAEIATATDLPVTADLEQGYGHDPDAVASTITAAGAAGAVGGSIEDLDPATNRLYPAEQAVDRVVAAVEAARALPFDFVLTARCEALGGRIDGGGLDTVIPRLQSFAAAGADVLYAPGLGSIEQIRAVVSSLDRPVNVVMGLGGPTFTIDEMAEAGVRRISVGSALARAAYGALLRAIDEMRDTGSFAFTADAVPYAELNRRLTLSG